MLDSAGVPFALRLREALRGFDRRMRGYASELLGMVTPGELQYTFFCNSGTEANEGALKIARRGGQNHQPSRDEIAARFAEAFGEAPW